MSENDFLPPGRSDSAGAASGGSFNPAASSLEPTAGALLRQARQAQGLHLAAMAASLKVPVEKLEALEQDRFDLLLDAVFTRALASGVCRLLKLDPNPILQRLPVLETSKGAPQNRGINEPFRPRSGAGSSWGTQLSKPVIFVGLALLLGAAVLVFLPTIQQQSPGRPSAPPTSSENPAAQPAGTPSIVHEPVPSSTPVVPPAPADESRLPVPSSAPSPSVLDTSPPAVATPPASAPASAPALNQPAGTGAMDSVATFTATDTSWVKVTDAKGTIVLARALRSGESAGVSGALPLSVLVGKAHAVQVQVRGQALDIKALAKNDVARFEVK